MRLNTAMVQRTLSVFEAQAIPENHPSLPELKGIFGDHTFFLDGSGLHIVEPTVPTAQGGDAAQVVRLASWQDANCTSLKPHAPEPTDVIVPLKTDGSGQ